MSSVREFLDHHFRHFNAREVVAAARAYEEHLGQGGQMLVSLAGAMSTAELGIILARMIRAGKVHALSVTGANLEEDVFNLVANREYELVPNWRALSAEDEKELYDRGLNRVTDTCIPETVMRHVEARLIERWRAACRVGERKMPAEFLWEVLDDPQLKEHFQIDPADSWLLAAKEAGIAVYSPGWEDSTTGNMLAGSVIAGHVPHHQCVMTGTEQFQRLMEWYRDTQPPSIERDGAEEVAPACGFFQVGGGIAGDFAICAVPGLIQDLKLDDTPFWGYFAQISDAVTSYGGYSGAPPNEKITWGKLDVETPRFMIQSDASIVAPLIFGYLLGD